MKQHITWIFTVGLVCLMAGCAAERAMLPTRVVVIPEVVSALETDKKPSVKLTESQASAVCRALRGSLQSDFCNKNMDPEILASWWNVQTNAIAIVRLNKDHTRYVWISFDQQGHLLADGAGNTLGDYSPWKR